MKKPAKKKPARGRGNVNGLAPTTEEVRRKEAEGYLTPAAAAAAAGVSGETIYRWAREWRPTKANEFGRSFGGKLGAFKDGPNLWVLVEALKSKRGTVAA